jgi:hypothetical protein
VANPRHHHQPLPASASQLPVTTSATLGATLALSQSMPPVFLLVLIVALLQIIILATSD